MNNLYQNMQGQQFNPATISSIPYKPITFEKLSNVIGMTYNLSAIENMNTISLPRGGEQTRALINANTMQELRDRLADRDRDLLTANFQLSQQAQSANIIGTLRPFPQPAYITCSPYESVYGNGCARASAGCGI